MSYELMCSACGDAFQSSRPHTRTCSHRCRQRLHVQSRIVTEELLLLSDVAWRLVSRGEVSPVDALGLVIWPSDRILAALDAREVVAA